MKQKYFNVNATVVNIYSDPDFKSAVVTQGLLGESCEIIDSKDDWFNVKQWDGYSGWLHKLPGIEEAKNYDDDLALRVYTSRLLGRDSSLVLHGGGNTSVKIIEKNIFSLEEEILYVKGSGWDLEFIEKAGFSPVRMDHMLNLSRLDLSLIHI